MFWGLARNFIDLNDERNVVACKDVHVLIKYHSHLTYDASLFCTIYPNHFPKQ